MNSGRLFRLVICFFVIVLLAAGAGCARKKAPAPEQKRTGQEEQNPGAAKEAGYVGSTKCRGCHENQYSGWEKSLHRLMVQDAAKGNVILGDFTKKGNPFEIAKQYKKEDIVYAIGSQWKQRYVVKNKDDFIILPAEWIVATKSWQPYHQEDWDQPHRHYEDLCIACHTTGYHAELGAKINEAGIGCEACHGPGRDHSGNPSSQNIVNPAKLSYKKQIEVCGQCHVRGQEIKGKREDALGYVPGGELTSFIKPLTPSEEELKKEKPAFFPDGASKKHHQQYNDYVQSRHYTREKASCSYCHESHDGKGTKGEIPLTKPVDQLCESCHRPGEVAANVKLRKPYLDNYLPKRAKSATEADIRSHTFKPGQPKTPVQKPPYTE